jgi:hypothetical protein
VPRTLDDPIFFFGTSAVTSADLDGDIDLDLIALTNSRIAIFFQETAGTFGGTPLYLELSLATGAPSSIVAADLDGDGDADLATANSFTVTVFFQERPGVFEDEPTVLGGEDSRYRPTSVTAADIDDDGDLDLVSADAGDGTLSIFEQTARGEFRSPPVKIGSTEPLFQPHSVVATDFDGDGDRDLVSANFLDPPLTVFRRIRPREFESIPLAIQIAESVAGASSLTPADFDRDGDLDLLLGLNAPSRLAVFVRESPGAYRTIPIIVPNPPSFQLGTGMPVDIDGDGDLDLTTIDSTNDRLLIFWGLH